MINGVLKKERRSSDHAEDDNYKKRKMLGPTVRLIIALLVGAGGTKGYSILSSEDKDQIDMNGQNVLVLTERMAAQDKLFSARLDVLNAQIKGLDDKVNILINRMK